MKSKSIFLILSALLFLSCTYNAKPEFVRLDRIALGEASLKNIDFEADAVFTNGNDIGGTLSTEKIDIYVDGKVLGHLSAKEFNVPARDTFSIPLKGKIATSKIFAKKEGGLLGSLLSIIQKKKVAVRFKGDILFQKGPFSYTYEVDKTDEIDIKL